MTAGNAQALLHRIALVRPGRESLVWLQDAVRDSQAGDLLAPVTVVVPSPYLGVHVRRALAAMGCANVRLVVQLRQIAERVARAGGAAAADQPLTGPLEAAAIRSAVRAAGGDALGRLADHRSLQDAIGALFRELRHRDDAGSILADFGDAGQAFGAYERLIRDYPDVPGLTRLAAEIARRATARPTWADELGALVVYLPPRLDDADVALLASLGRHVPIAAPFARCGDAQADQLGHDAATDLAAVLGTSVQTLETAAAGPEIRLLSAPDPEEETHSVVRRLMADLESGVPLWRMAVLYTSEEAYGGPAREALDASGVPWHSALGRPASAGWAPRSLLGLLGLADRRFAREAVLDWIAGRPTRDEQAGEDALPAVPMSAWDRLSRRAQVLDGPHQWVQRFEHLAQALEREEQARADWHAEARAEEDDAEAPRPACDSQHARAIAAAVARLDRDTRPPGDTASWGEFVDWAARLRQTYAPPAASWPETERAASDALDAALESLRAASLFEPTTSPRVFRETLAAALDERRLPEGEPGTGVLVGPLGSITGAAFDRVYVLGMAEGLLPAQPAADPLAPATDGARDPLARRERQRQTDRRGLLASLTAAAGGQVTLSYPRSDGAARAVHPSRWFLEQAALCEGVPAVYASDLPRLFAAQRPWLERIASAYDGLVRCETPANLADLRLRSVARWHAAGHDLGGHPLAARSDLPLGQAIRAGRARRSRRFTEFDGNLESVSNNSTLVVRPFTGEAGASSATSIQRWAGCPFQYLLVNVLKVEATRRPEDEWTITPLDKGTLVHAVFERFFRELHARGRLTPDDVFTAADHARLDELAEELFRELVEQGRTGHPLAWDNARAAILADLHAQLERDQAWRQQDGVVPARFESTFGYPDDPDTWPAVEVPLGAHGLLARFRGAIDRVDLSPDGRRAMVIDYKTGSTWGYDGLEDDPVLDGHKVQLALYARALRNGLPGGEALEEITAEYRFVSSKGGFQRKQIQADAQVDARLDEVVRRVAAGIGSGVFLPNPGPRKTGGFENCRFCDYDRVCSTTRDEAWERKDPAAHSQLIPLDRLVR